MRLALCLAALVVLALVIVSAPADAAGSAAVEGCARINHFNSANPSHRATFRASLDTLEGNSACAPQTYTLMEGECLTFNLRTFRQGSLAPSPANRWEVYWGPDDAMPKDHGSTGKSNWNDQYRLLYIVDPHGTPHEACATTNGLPARPGVAGLYRLVLRACDVTAPGPAIGCESVTTYDTNSDLNPTCTCSGDPGTGYSADGNPGSGTAHHDPDKDPLTLGVEETKVAVGRPVNVTVDARLLNQTMRPGAGSNITLHFEAPDHTWPVDGANPVEMTFSDGTGTGRYHYTFTPAQVGRYELIARTISSLNERHISKPLALNVVAAADLAETRGAADAREARLNASFERLLGAIQYGTSEARNTTGVKVSDKTGYSLTSAERDAIATASAAATWTSPTRALTDKSGFSLTPSERDEISTDVWTHGSRTITGGTVDGDMSLQDFLAWRDGEYRSHRAFDNASARETTAEAARVAAVDAGATAEAARVAAVAAGTRAGNEGNMTREADDAHNTSLAGKVDATYGRVDDARTILIDHGRASNQDHARHALETGEAQGELARLHRRADVAEELAPEVALGGVLVVLVGSVIARGGRRAPVPSPSPPSAPAPRRTRP